MSINLESVALVLGLIITIGGLLAKMYKLMHELSNRIEQLEKQAAHRKEDDALMLRALSAVLDGLHEQGCNNTVTTMRAELSAHLIESR